MCLIECVRKNFKVFYGSFAGLSGTNPVREKNISTVLHCAGYYMCINDGFGLHIIPALNRTFLQNETKQR